MSNSKAVKGASDGKRGEIDSVASLGLNTIEASDDLLRQHEATCIDSKKILSGEKLDITTGRKGTVQVDLERVQCLARLTTCVRTTRGLLKLESGEVLTGREIFN